MHEITKFINSTRIYTVSDLASIKEDIEKYESRKLADIIELFNLPINSQSRQLYQLLLKELKKRNFLNLQFNAIQVFKNIEKYLHSASSTAEL
jgi:hypothetical protein